MQLRRGWARLSTAAAVSAAMLVVLVSPSHASSGGQVYVANGYARYIGSDVNNTVWVNKDGYGKIVFEEPYDGLTAKPGGGCLQTSATKVTCPNPGAVDLRLGAGDDTVRIGMNGRPAFGVYTVVWGESGGDTYHGGTDAGSSRVSFWGGVGRDTADYSLSGTGVHVDLAYSTEDGRPGDRDAINEGTDGIVGSDYDDTLIGDYRDNFLYGNDGADTLLGREGGDYLYALDYGVKDAMVDCGVGGTGVDWAVADKVDPVRECAKVVRS